MARRLTILLILLVVCYHGNHVETAMSNHLQTTATLCISLCKYAAFYGNNLYCGYCAENPPVNHDMCYFACGTQLLNKYNIKYLGRICEVCFQNVSLMTSICRECASKNVGKDSRLCTECYGNGFRHDWW